MIRIDITQDELDILSEAYLKCELSKTLEDDLELVLNSTKLTSPLIEEAKKRMGITAKYGSEGLAKSERQKNVMLPINGSMWDSSLFFIVLVWEA